MSMNKDNDNQNLFAVKKVRLPNSTELVNLQKLTNRADIGKKWSREKKDLWKQGRIYL